MWALVALAVVILAATGAPLADGDSSAALVHSLTPLAEGIGAVRWAFLPILLTVAVLHYVCASRITVASIVTTSRTVSQVPNAPPKNGQYVVADISIECVSQAPCYFDAFDWNAVNPSGQGFREAFLSKEPALRSGELSPDAPSVDT